MSVPRLLLVDDSDAVLAFEVAALGRAYECDTASDGREALAQLEHRRPDAVLLDLSMPVMDGEAVLEHMRADPELAQIPVVVISSEHARALACREKGATAVLPKPIEAEALRRTVGEVLAARSRSLRERSTSVLELLVGDHRLALRVSEVIVLLPELATTPLSFGPGYLREWFLYQGTPVAVLDLARRLSTKHRASRVDRKIAVVAGDGVTLGLRVDDLRGPYELEERELVSAARVGGAHHLLPESAAHGVALLPAGPTVVLCAAALVRPAVTASLGNWAREERARAAATGESSA